MIFKKLVPSSWRKKMKLYKLTKKGVLIGPNTSIYTSIDNFGSEPYLISIGSKCVISGDVHFFTHDGGVNVINHIKGTSLDKMGRISIGDNVFIGFGSLLLPNVHVGSNSIVGAGSVVTKDIPEGVVAAGVPCKVICSVEEYWQKNQDHLLPTHGMPFKKKKAYLLSHIK
jgi:acetyltransferase-like isoleucine patch superfamily enzyme